VIDRLRERPGKLLPTLLFAAVAALSWWLGLLAIGVAEIVFDEDRSNGVSETLDQVSWWILMTGLVAVPVATLAWSRAIASSAGPTVSGVVVAFVAYIALAVPMFVLWVFLYELIAGEPWNL
jgi:hypothetical protein